MVARPALTPKSARSPRLLVLVFGIFLVLIGITGSALVAATSSHVASTTLNAIVDRDRALVDLFTTNGSVHRHARGSGGAHRRSGSPCDAGAARVHRS